MSAPRPSFWRRSLDYAAIEDIHSIKRQINAQVGEDATIAGHDIKLGRGGIREIEFFAQTQQLILGGRTPALRLSRTVDALAALAERGIIAKETQADLTATYDFLRNWVGSQGQGQRRTNPADTPFSGREHCVWGMPVSTRRRRMAAEEAVSATRCRGRNCTPGKNFTGQPLPTATERARISLKTPALRAIAVMACRLLG